MRSEGRPHITDVERRARLVDRHRLGAGAADVSEAVRALVALHSSDPISPHLSLRARVAGFTSADLDHCLYESRRLWRMHAMRRTLFVVEREEAPVFEAAVGREIEGRERRRIEGWLAQVMDAADVPAWLAHVESRVVEVLSDGSVLATATLTSAVPELATRIEVGSGRWNATTPVAPRVLFLLGLRGEIVRTRPAGSWRSSQYRWAATATWFGRRPEPIDAGEGRRRLAHRYLEAFGPVTQADLAWWTGWTRTRSKAVLTEIQAESVGLDDGGEGFVLPGDLGNPGMEAGRVAFLPGLDPTPMGWKNRGWFLGEHGSLVFDRNGNAGPTVWLDGRIVGAWAQPSHGEVSVRLLEDVPARSRRLIDERAAELSSWLGGVVATPRFRSPVEREIAEGG